MTNRDPYSLLLYDAFQAEFVDDCRTEETHRSIDSARWGALVLSEELGEEERTLGNDHEVLPYKIYVVGPDGSRTLCVF